MRAPCLHIAILTAFLLNTFGPLPMAQAQEYRLPAPGVMVHLSPPLDPPILKGIKFHTDNPFRFDFILDRGDTPTNEPLNEKATQKNKPNDDQELRTEATRLIKYFLASLTIPEKDLWVNLSPYEKDRIIPNSFGLTEMGRDLLAEDYMLKQITASLIYPEDKVGKRFWRRVYEQAAKKYGNTNISVNTFNKVWIIPDKAVVYENAKAGTAYVVESKLKVMLEQDYLSLEKHQMPTNGGLQLKASQGTNRLPINKDINALGAQIVREIVLPELTKEVNEDKNFAKLRQVYNSLILATWYKKKIKDSILAQVYADKNKVAGVGYENSFPLNVETIYLRYLQAFKRGVFNYIKEDTDTLSRETIPRKYFSGGMNLDFSMSSYLRIQTVADRAMLLDMSNLKNRALEIISTIKGFGKQAQDTNRNHQSPKVSFESVPVPQNVIYFNLVPFLQAQKRLKSLSRVELEELLSSLGILKAGERLGTQNLDEYYTRVYDHLAQVGYSEQIIKKIKGDAQPDVALDRTVGYQSGSSKIESILEAVANSIDALGGEMGQFGMGVKQILAWLENPEERIEVFSRQKGKPPYCLVIIRQEGGFKAAIFQSTKEEFQKATGGLFSQQGTVIAVFKSKDIPQDGEGVTLKRLEQEIHDAFSPVKGPRIWTRFGFSEFRLVNGWEHKKVLAGLANLKHENAPEPKSRQNEPVIVVSLEPRILRVIDPGKGMDLQIMSRMLLPVDGGDKENKVMTTPEEIDAETQKTSLVHDPQGMGPSIIFARNGRVMSRVTLHPVIKTSILAGELMVDLGRLIRVSPSWDKIVLQRNQDEEPLKKGVLSLVRLVLHNDYSNEEKVKIINTLIGGLEGIAPGNKAVTDIINEVKNAVKTEMTSFISNLRKEGAIILPLRDGFDNFQMPQGQSVVFLNEGLFDWRGAEIKQLKEYLGASVLPMVLEATDKDSGNKIRNLILTVPFRPQVWQQYQARNFEDIMRIIKTQPLPVVRGDGYVIVPSQIGDLIVTLSEDDKKKEEKLELIKIIAEEDTANSYDLVKLEAAAYAAFGVKEEPSDKEKVKTNWKAEEDFLEWNDEKSYVTTKPYGPQEMNPKYNFDGERAKLGNFYKDINVKEYILKDVPIVAEDVAYKFRKLGKLELNNTLPKDLGDYLDSLGGEGRISSSTEPAKIWDSAMSALPKKIAFEEHIRSYTLADFEKEKRCTLVARDNTNILYRYTGKKTRYVLLRVNGREIEKFWSLAMPFGVEDGVIKRDALVLQEANGLRELSFNLGLLRNETNLGEPKPKVEATLKCPVWVESAQMFSNGRIMTSSLDGKTRIWREEKTGEWQLEARIEGNGAQILPDGRIMMSDLLGKTKILHEANPGEWQVESTLDGVSAQALSDGRILTSFQGKMMIWIKMDRAWKIDAEIDAVLEGIKAQMQPDGRILTANSDGGQVKIWSEVIPGKWEAMAKLEGRLGFRQPTQMLPDGRILTASYDGSEVMISRQLSPGEWQVEAIIDGYSGQILPDGRILMEDKNGIQVRIVSEINGKWQIEATLEGRAAKVLSDGRILTTSSDGSSKIWRETSPREWQVDATLVGHSSDIESVQILTDGRILTASRDTTAKIWNFLKPQTKEFQIRLNVSSEKSNEWRQKLSTAYEELIKFVPEDTLQINRSDYEDSFNFFYGLLRQRMEQVIEGKTSAESQLSSIDALVDDVAKTLHEIDKGLKDFWPEFFEENILSLQSHEREDFYHRFFKTLLQAAVVDGINTREDINDIIKIMAYGWSLDSPASIESAKAVYQLIESFKSKNMKDYPLLSKIVCSIQLTLRNKEVSAKNNLINQVNRIMNSEASEHYLELIFDTFKGTAWKVIEKAVAKDDFQSLGRLGSLLVFLTTKTDLVAEDVKTEDQEIEWQNIGEGIWLDQLDVWNSSAENGVRSVEDISLEHDRIASLNGEAVERIRQNIRSKIEGLRESGGYAAELAQNYLDAMVLARQKNPKRKGNMRVKFYFDPVEKEFVEEAQDNGSGAPNGQELALLIRKSNKYDLNTGQKGLMGMLAGFFGTGKFTQYAGVDSVEIVSRGERRVYSFVVEVDRTQGRPKLIKLGWRDRNAEEQTGFMIRRNKKASTIIPELEQMFAESAWKINAGFAVTDQDELELEINNQVRPVRVTGKDVLFQGAFYAPNLSSPDAAHDVLIEHGVFRIWEHHDPEIPSQIIDKKGLRVEDIALKEKFLALVPQRIRRIVDKMGIAIQIPLALYESRNGFAQEEEYLPFIQKYIALGIYRAMMSKHLSDESFTIDRIISSDFESKSSYNAAFNKNRNPLFVDGRHMFDIVNGINNELDQPQVASVSNKELETLRAWFDGEVSGLQKNSIKQFLALLEVDFNNEKGVKERGSLVLRRIKTLMQVSPRLASALAAATGRSMENANSMSDEHAIQREVMAETLKIIDITPIDDWIISPETDSEKQLLQIGLEFGKIFGIDDVLLAKSDAPFRGLFSDNRFLLNQSLAEGVSSAGGFSQKVETIVHELGHLLQIAKQSGSKVEKIVTRQDEGFNGWTHDDEFSQMMKWASFFILSKLSGTITPKKDSAMLKIEKGGIDLTAANMNLQTQNNGGEIKFHLDPAMLRQLQNAPGFVPVIINIQPMMDLRQFLGLNVQERVPAAS
ncbi:MAG: hypothetical protein HQL12_04320 [Candidatus Omnitrophica bacterium]|nr:hypothetical protein [Candidatus Omnitrophota bacterium]